MPRYVALLRGIGPMNPNMRNAKLREVCADLGFRNVRSVVSSGNLVFDAGTSDAAGVQRQLEAAWPRQLGFEITSIVRTCEELDELWEFRPFGDRVHGAGTELVVTFAQDPLDTSFTVPHEPGPGSTIVAVTDRELFTLTDTTTAKTSKVMGWMEREFGKAITSRTWLTVQRILAKCRPGTD